MFRRRKGVSTIIGASIFVGILLLAFSSLQFFMRDLSGLSDSFATMAMFDEDRRKESLIIEKISLTDLTSKTADVSATSTAGASLYPLLNMNFTDNADGWTFYASLYNAETPPSAPVTLTSNDDDGDADSNDDKEFAPPSSNGVLPVGGFTGGWSDQDLPSDSGAGSIFSHFSFVSSSSSDQGGALMTWTYPFTLDSNTASAISNADFTIGYYIPEAYQVKGPGNGGTATIFYTITDPGGTTHAIEIEQEKDELSWNSKAIPSSRLVPSVSWTAGDYKLQITLIVDLQAKKPSDKEVAQFKIYFDDVGIKLNLSNASAQSITMSSYDETYFDSSEQFNVGSSPSTISSLDFSIQASSSVAAEQYVFLYDFSRSTWTLSLSSSISSSTSNVKLTKGSLDVPRFAAQTAGSYTVDPGVSEIAAVGDVWVRILVSAVSTSSFTYLADITLDSEVVDNDKVSFVVKNTGGITTHIVRYWIVTGAQTTSVDVDTYLDPAKSTTLSQSITPTSGTVEIRLITERGSIASLTENV